MHYALDWHHWTCALPTWFPIICPAAPLPRAYPSGLGDAIHAAYLEQLKGPPHGDLRVERTPTKTKGPVELFQEMELGDCWSDANLKECFDYLYNCRHTRTYITIYMCLKLKHVALPSNFNSLSRFAKILQYPEGSHLNGKKLWSNLPMIGSLPQSGSTILNCTAYSSAEAAVEGWWSFAVFLHLSGG